MLSNIECLLCIVDDSYKYVIAADLLEIFRRMSNICNVL